MQYSSKILETLVEEFGRLPGIGRKSAQRMAFYLLRQPREDVLVLADAIRDVKERVVECAECGNIAESDVCLICSDPRRTRGLICVVENPVDVVAIERTSVFNGVYHVLGGGISPLDGVGPDDIRTRELLARVDANAATEVILATSASSVGEATAHYLEQLLRGKSVRVTRIARGLPMGADLEFADQVTVQKALEGRRDVTGT